MPHTMPRPARPRLAQRPLAAAAPPPPAPGAPRRAPSAPRAISPPAEGRAAPAPQGEVKPTGYNVADWAAAFESQLGEYSYRPRVEGALPPWLKGTLFRNGPSRFERGGRRYAHMLDGDGAVAAFTFDGEGGVHFRSRFVRTRELADEEYANKILYRSTFGTAPPGGALTNALRLRIKNASNTHAVCWGGRLLSLWEAGAPYELDPATLATLPSPPSLGGLVRPGLAPSTTGLPALDAAAGLGNALTAHPHVVPPPAGDAPDAGWRLATWAWASKMTVAGPELGIEVGEYDSNWTRVARARVTLPDAAFNPHDVAVTPHAYIFFQAATSMKLAPYLLGLAGPAQCVEVGGPRVGGAHVWVVPRGAHHPPHAAPVCLETDPFFAVHHAGAWEEETGGGGGGRTLVVWSTGWGPAELARVRKGGGVLGSWRVVLDGDFDDIPFTALWETRVDVEAGTVTRRPLFDEHAMEHPKTHPRLATRPARHVWFTQAVSAIPGRTAPPQAFTHLDTATGAVDSYAPGRRCFTEEIVFVPRPGADPVADPAAETDGVLLAMVFDGATKTSALYVLDAAHVGDGPIAVVRLDHHIPHGLHGDWCDAVFT